MRIYGRFLATSMLVLTVLALLTACGGSDSANPPTVGGAGNSSIVPITGAGAADSGTPSDAQELDTIQGQVVQIDGQKLIIKNESGSSVTVQLNDSTTVQKHERGAISDIQTGTSISVIALKQNDSLQAIDVQIGGDARQLPAAAPVPLAGDQPIPGGGNGGVPAGMPQPQSLHGTVEQLDGATLTLKSDDGQSMQIALTTGMFIQKVSQGSVSDIKPGTSVIAAGKRNGNAFEVVQLNLMMSMQAP